MEIAHLTARITEGLDALIEHLERTTVAPSLEHDLSDLVSQTKKAKEQVNDIGKRKAVLVLRTETIRIQKEGI